MDKVLLDRDMLIDHLRGYEPARQYLKRFEMGEVQGYLSIITVAELAAGQMRQSEVIMSRRPRKRQRDVLGMIYHRPQIISQYNLDYASGAQSTHGGYQACHSLS
jgi:hypothetical protein